MAPAVVPGVNAEGLALRECGQAALLRKRWQQVCLLGAGTVAGWPGDARSRPDGPAASSAPGRCSVPLAEARAWPACESPCLPRSLRRALSTRIRRIASAAAAKK